MCTSCCCVLPLLSFILLLKLKGPPDPPTDVYVIPFTTAISVFWIQGSNGGFHQRFYLEYKTEASIIWNRKSLPNDSLQLQYYTINKLTPNTQYQVKIFSRNLVGRSNATQSVFINTTG